MSEQIHVPMTSEKGVLLKTGGKFCESDIVVTPDGDFGGSGFYTVEETETGGSHYIFTAEESSGVKLNIAYGNTEPRDTTKLWVKTEEPSSVLVSPNKTFDGPARTESLELLSTTLPVAITDASSVTIDDKIYVIADDGTASTAKIYCFDTLTKTVSTLSTTGWVNSLFKGGACAAVGEKIYLFGGNQTGSSQDVKTSGVSIQIFDTETLTFSTSSATYGYYDDVYLKTYGVVNVGCTVVGSIIYLFGGQSRSKTLKWISEFDTDQDKFTYTETYLPSPTSAPQVVTVSGKIYILGGTIYPDGSTVNYGTVANTDIYRYDPIDHSITILNGVSVSNTIVRCCVFNNKIYAFCGDAFIYSINPATNKIKLMNRAFQVDGFTSNKIGRASCRERV